MADYPRPKQVLVCDTCGQPWNEHIAAAEIKLTATSEDDDYEPREVEAEDIDFQICIQLLKDASRGPMGYPGPMGPPGITGPTGRKGDKGDPGVVQFEATALPIKEKND